MKIKTLKLGLIATNCYMISSDNAAIVIDPGFKSEETRRFFEINREKKGAVLLTHAHFDHIGDAEELRKEFSVPIYTGENEAVHLADTEYMLSDRFHAHVRPFDADILLSDNESFTVGDIEIKTLLTPGHTGGSVSYLIGNRLFSGDTLFRESVGRTDFIGGNAEKLAISLKKLFSLPDDTAVFPGHNDSTDIGHEKRYNPYASGWKE